ncbi:MAG: SIR2 family protein [Chloroflexi bacterium]|nr:SIR2 family protein [Chloroflexota bacterium]
MNEQHWQRLIKRITDDRKCTPIIGPGINQGILTPRSELAQTWAAEHGYPLTNDSSLVHVAKFLSVHDYRLSPHDKMSQEIADAAPPDFAQPNQPHALLADLNLPIYLTTNYDDYMFQALEHRRLSPERAICHWNAQLAKRYDPLLPNFTPAPATPLVYHLHGHVQSPDTMVIREDDYFDFLINMVGSEENLPPPVREAMSATSLLFIGYNPTDWDFMTLLRGLVKATDSSLRRISVTAQFPLPQDAPKAAQTQAQTYLAKYIQEIDDEIHLYWGTTQDFLTELRQRIKDEATETAESSGPTRISQVALYHKMKEHFDLDELDEIAFELEIDSDNLPKLKDKFARKLISKVKDRQRLPELVELVRQKRPNVAW